MTRVLDSENLQDEKGSAENSLPGWLSLFEARFPSAFRDGKSGIFFAGYPTHCWRRICFILVFTTAAAVVTAAVLCMVFTGQQKRRFITDAQQRQQTQLSQTDLAACHQLFTRAREPDANVVNSPAYKRLSSHLVEL